MQILKNSVILQKQSANYITGELSNIAAVVQAPQILVTLYTVDPDLSTTMDGLKNINDWIGENSTVVYNKIENFPLSGIDQLVEQATFDEEVGFDEDFESAGIAFPNTHMPKPNDCFVIENSNVTALYKITGIEPTTVRSNPFIGFTFKLYSRDPEKIKQLERQVHETYTTTVTAIGLDKNLVITKEALFQIEDHVKNYVELASLYSSLFWSPEKAAFIYDGVYDEETGVAQCFIDMTLWRLMFDEGIVIYDDVITYANNNFNMSIPTMYTGCPDVYVDDYKYRRSILYRLYSQYKKDDFDEYRFPQGYSVDPRIGKFTGTHLVYFEHYGNKCDAYSCTMACPVWDDEFLSRLYNGQPYEREYPDYEYCEGCSLRCKKLSAEPCNTLLRNAIINWYNGQDIDWENLKVTDAKSTENYFLIPLLLGVYKQYIKNLQK